MTRDTPETFLRRAAMGLWLCGVAALGLLQFYARTLREPPFAPGTIDWLWLAGSLTVAVVGIGLVIRAARRQRGRARQTGRPST